MSDAPALLPPSDLALAAERVRTYLRNTRAENTYKAYAADWRQFELWCGQHGLTALPAAPQTVMLYFGELGGAGKRLSTIGRRLAALAQIHRAAGFDSPSEHLAVRELLSGMRRTHGTASHGKEALLSKDLRLSVRELGDSLRDVRDRALLLIGFAGAFRRSELVAVEVEHVVHVSEGLVVKILRSKSDQEGQGREIAIPFGSHAETCPVQAWGNWVVAGRIKAGPVFRGISRHGRISDRALTPTAVALLVKERATAAGLDASVYAGHSLRAGFATSAAIGGAPEWAIMKQTGHRSCAMLDRYVRPAGRFRNNPVGYTGL
jgi:site-specific recombinase XerD